VREFPALRAVQLGDFAVIRDHRCEFREQPVIGFVSSACSFGFFSFYGAMFDAKRPGIQNYGIRLYRITICF